MTDVGVLDRSMLLLRTLASEPMTLTEIAKATGIPRSTAHRLLSALQHHGLVSGERNGAWHLDHGIFDLGATSLLQAAERSGAITTVLLHHRLVTEHTIDISTTRRDHRVTIARLPGTVDYPTTSQPDSNDPIAQTLRSDRASLTITSNDTTTVISVPLRLLGSVAAVCSIIGTFTPTDHSHLSKIAQTLATDVATHILFPAPASTP